jgi:hypothetical protein
MPDRGRQASALAYTTSPCAVKLDIRMPGRPFDEPGSRTEPSLRAPTMAASPREIKTRLRLRLFGTSRARRRETG